MQTTQIRQKLHQYIDDTFTAEDIKEFDERREKRLSGETRTYSWEEAKDIITGKKTL